MTRLARLRRSLLELFPERHLYVRSGGEMKGYVLTPKTQMIVAAGISAAALWMGVCSAAMLVNMLSASSADREVARTQAKYERWIADRQARLNTAVAELNAGGGSNTALAANIEKRHVALAMLLTDMKGAPGAAAALTPVIDKVAASSDRDPAHIVAAVTASQEQLLDAADSFAKSRADRLRLAFRLAGLTPAAYMPQGGALGGPLIETKDPRALAAVLDVDENFAERIQHAANDMSEAHALESAAQSLPFAKPTPEAERSSSFGVRVDPFTGRPAFHSGQDFSGSRMEAIHATAPGVVSFTGVRNGYGNTVEVDHGRGLKTRYAHLAAISVVVGQQVALGQRLGGMGSTGRSTGTHLHYEVWLNGRAMNPDRFLKAGDYVQQAE
ncbi:MAG TPA: peptidoglycan DD-metalloendopeptidase family protein [Phenylobacterium sp.]|jgi:murein DD-endopeptidase MepM/ murein hydrolase activator NlpD|uniref:M23 family metallopeptidase n=1 Tax=Phenylobacterium sp. TaxID=1871053 RepID=UPI002D743231|nr:peptidoglycan DD-metalloendopeptidase family protein [Phenylobacterium sp.]HZZ69776.1 peptidoglycan DD-metalloendopeptidase family protein [Phenylobacterium sp.]